MDSNSSPENDIRCGVVALAGPPNAGKSTLLNSLIGQKISIVSPKPQTTRNRILGIVNGPGHQIILLDTPGLHHAKSPLNLELMRIARETMGEVDVILFMIDATAPVPKGQDSSLRYLAGTETPVILVLNKIDLVSSKDALLPRLAAYQKLHPFKAFVPVSATSGDGLDTLANEITALLPIGPKLYPDDIPTDATVRFIASELIREKVFLLTSEEIPYSTAVAIDAFSENEESGLTTIHATILVEKSTQKGIIIGKQGAMLKKIGEAARREIEEMLDCRVMLKLWVRVQKNWASDQRFLRELGL